MGEVFSNELIWNSKKDTNIHHVITNSLIHFVHYSILLGRKNERRKPEKYAQIHKNKHVSIIVRFLCDCPEENSRRVEKQQRPSSSSSLLSFPLHLVNLHCIACLPVTVCAASCIATAYTAFFLSSPFIRY